MIDAQPASLNQIEVRVTYESAIAHLRNAVERFIASEDLNDRVATAALERTKRSTALLVE